MSQIITLTTDFGQQDHYVSAMKAVMLGIAPDARFVDVSHEIPPQDIMAGAWVIRKGNKRERSVKHEKKKEEK